MKDVCIQLVPRFEHIIAHPETKCLQLKLIARQKQYRGYCIAVARACSKSLPVHSFQPAIMCEAVCDRIDPATNLGI